MSNPAAKKRNSRARTTQLTDVMSFPADTNALKEEIKRRLIIDPAVHGSVPNSTPEIKFVRKGLGIRNLDGTEGNLIFDTDRLFCFGVSEAKNPETGALNGYSMAISMYDRDGATERQLRTVAFITALTDVLKEVLLSEECKEETGFYELEAADLKKFSGLFYKKDRGKIVPDSTPTFYPKIIYFKPGTDKNGKPRDAKMVTKFYLEDEVDENGEPVEVNPLDYIGVKCYATTAIKVECIFMGAKTINIQCKATEAEVKASETGPTRLLRVSRARTQTIGIGSASNPLMRPSSSLESSSSSSSISVSSVHSGKNELSDERKESKTEERKESRVEEKREEKKLPEKPKKTAHSLVASDDENEPAGDDEEEPVVKPQKARRVVRKVPKGEVKGKELPKE